MKNLQVILLMFFLTFAVSCGQQKKYIEYKVKEGETMRAIAKKLDMKTRDLLRLNPDVSRRPNANTVIIVPNKKSSTPSKKVIDVVVSDDPVDNNDITETDTIKEKDLLEGYLTHTIIKGDTFYSLTRFYNVTEKELKMLNPDLSEGLKLGQVIKIKEQNEDTEQLFYHDEIREGVSLKVAFLLPFRTKKFDTITAKDIFKKNKLANIVTDFYLGAEIAIDSLQKQGVQIELMVYDTEKKGTKIRQILFDNNFNDIDVIIGPLYANEVKIVANNVTVPIVFPVYSKSQSLFSSSKIIKTAPEKKEYEKELVNFIKEKYSGENIVVVSDKEIKGLLIKSMLETYGSIVDVKVILPQKGYIEKERFMSLLNENQKNWIVIATSNNVIASDAINSLISLPENTDVRVFATEKKKIFDKIDNNRLAQVSFTFVTDTFVDENSLSALMFNKQYKEKNYTYPSYFATKGFDITYDVLIRLASGDDLKQTFKKGVSYRLESKFEYDKKLFKPTNNYGLFIVKYNKDLSLTRLK